MTAGEPTTTTDPVGGATGVVTAELAISGMHCGSCSALIEETLVELPGVVAVAVDLDGASGTVTFDPATADLDGLCAAVTELGYLAAPATGRGASPEGG